MHSRDTLLADLSAVIAFPSVESRPEQKEKCMQWIRARFLDASKVPVVTGDAGGSPYLYLRHPSPQLLWFAHVDVVPGRDDQFILAVDGDIARGRGAKDMKGAAIAFLTAYAESCVSGSVPPVSILLTTDEEIGGETPHVLADKGMFDGVPVAYTPDCGEQTTIVTEAKGAVWGRLTVQGQSGHAAYPWQSRNPVRELGEALHALHERFPIGTGDDWQMTVTPTELVGSSAVNRIPNRAEAVLDIRFPASIARTPDDALAIVAAVIPDFGRLEKIQSAVPLDTDPAHPMVQLYKRIAEEVTGETISIGREHGSSDARSFAARGIPAFIHGPRGGDLHGEQVWVSVTSLLEQVEISRRWLRELAT